MSFHNKMRDVSVLLSVYVLIIVGVSKISAQDFGCKPPLFKCWSYCINPDLLCDAYNDCIEDEDDELCANNTCVEYAFRCHNGACIDGDEVCNGQRDCSDSSDESYHLCKGPSNPVYENCGKFPNDDHKTTYPWHAGLWMENPAGAKRLCSATIITPRFAVSIAECLWDTAENKAKEGNFTLVAGYDGSQFTQFRTVVNIETTVYFQQSSSDWKRNHYNYNLLTLDKALEFNEYVQAACIDNRRFFNNFNIQGTMVSWSIGPGKTQEPQQLNVSYYEDCQSELNIPEKLPYLLDKPCLNSSECGPLSDQGAGLFVEENGTFYLRGILNPPIGDATVLLCNYRLFSILDQFEMEKLLNVGNMFIENEKKELDAGGCREYEFRCKSGECIASKNVCDGVNDCSNGFDEDENICNKTELLHTPCGNLEDDTGNKPFPWHAAVWNETEEGPFKICGATIISEKYAVSSADCFWDNVKDRFSTNVFTLSAGHKDIYYDQFRTVSRVKINGYKQKVDEFNYINNFALIELETPFKFNEYISAACVDIRAREYQYIYTRLYPKTVSVEKSISGPHVVKLIDKGKFLCRTRLPSFIGIPLGQEKICMGSNTCTDPLDAGSGMFIKKKGLYYIQGIADKSFGQWFCTINQITNIVPFVDIIKQEVKTESPVDISKKKNVKFLKTKPPNWVVIDLNCPASDLKFSTKCEETTECADDLDIFKCDIIEFPLYKTCQYEYCVTSIHKCRGDVFCSNVNYTCGKFDTNDKTSPFPWHAALWLEKDGTPTRICAATIISDFIALTATDCFTKINNTNADNFVLSAGYKDDYFDQFSRVEKIDLSKFSSQNIALIELKTPLKFNRYVAPICLMDQEMRNQHDSDKEATMISWSTPPNNGAGQVNIEFIDNCPSNSSRNDILCGEHENNGLTNDLGAGVFIQIDNRYFMRTILNKIDVEESVNIYTGVLNITDEIEKVIASPEYKRIQKPRETKLNEEQITDINGKTWTWDSKCINDVDIFIEPCEPNENIPQKSEINCVINRANRTRECVIYPPKIEKLQKLNYCKITVICSDYRDGELFSF